MHEDCGVDWWCDQAKNAEGGGSNKQDSTALHGEPSTFDTQERMMSPSLSFSFVRVYIIGMLIFHSPSLIFGLLFYITTYTGFGFCRR